MKQIFNILILLAVCTSSMTFVSCQETEAVDDYENWEVRNQLFIDSIAQVCDKNADGKWVRLCAYNLDETVENQKGNKNHYVYVHKNVEGTGTTKPQFNDSIRVHYLGRLIPTTRYPSGYIFDKSYNGSSLNEKTDVPAIYSAHGTTTGFITSVLNMVEGDDWTIYIPSYLGYGESGSTKVHENSTLIFNVKLAKIYKYELNMDCTWY